MARRMLTERMLAIAPIVIAIVSGAFIAVLMPTTWMSIAVFVGTAVVVLLLVARGGGRRD